MRLVIFSLLLASLSTSAQVHNEFWTRLNITHSVGGHWSIGLDMQHRRQANYLTGEKNLFHYPMSSSVRVWVYYQLKKQWQLITSPIGFFENDNILNSTAAIKKNDELRTIVGVSKTIMIKRVKNKTRFIFENRFIDFYKSDYHFQTRYRLQSNVTIPLHKKISPTGMNYVLFDELYIKTEKHTTDFDQNRVYNALQWKLKHTDIDLGYQWVLQQNPTTTLHRNQFFIIFNLAI